MVARAEGGGYKPTMMQELARQLNIPPEGIVPVPGSYLDEVREMSDPGELRALLIGDMKDNASLYARPGLPFKPEAPFIYYTAMNREPEMWVALAKAKVAKAELQIGDGKDWVIMTVPRSAKWEEPTIRESGLFPEAEFWPLIKDGEIPPEFKPQGVDVLSYVHKRQDDGSRGTEMMQIADPAKLEGKSILLFDDALAEGWSLYKLVRALRGYSVARVDAIVTLSKGNVQGGQARVTELGVLDTFLCMASVKNGSINPELAGREESVSIAGNMEFESI